MAATRTKYFKDAESNLTHFELFCKAHGLDQSEVMNDLVGKFLKENASEPQLGGVIEAERRGSNDDSPSFPLEPNASSLSISEAAS
jgi:hypothetical protein